MSTPKHTPGPWYAANMGNDFQGLVVEEQTGKTIAVAYDKRDVHILAAAPAMYEALKELVTYLQDHVEDEALDNWAPVLKAAYALAQAEVKP